MSRPSKGTRAGEREEGGSRKRAKRGMQEWRERRDKRERGRERGLERGRERGRERRREKRKLTRRRQASRNLRKAVEQRSANELRDKPFNKQTQAEQVLLEKEQKLE